jgi:F-type H+-transporting ATPase subunit alpha
MAVQDQVAVVYAATNGFVDRIHADRVPEFHQGLVERMHAEIPDTLKKIADGDWSDETQKALDDAIAQYAEDFGYDLDEEGHPLTDEQAIQEGGRRREEREEEAEPAAA